MIGTNIKIKNFDNGKEIALNDHLTDKENVIALQVFPSFQTDVRPQNIPKNSTHGEYRLPYYYSGMSIILDGVIAGESEQKVWEMKKALDDVMQLSRSGYGKQYDSEIIDEVILTNECTNPNGKISTAGWLEFDSNVSTDLIVETTEATESGIYMVIGGDKPTGKKYYAACSVKNNANSDRTFRIRIIARDSGASTLLEVFDDTVVSGETESRIFKDITLPANVEDIVVSVTRLDDDAVLGDVFEVSNVLIVEDTNIINPEIDYFDGSSPELSLIAFNWSGDAELSTSEIKRKTFESFDRNTIRISFTDPNGRNVFIDASPIKTVSYDRPLKQKFLLNWQVVLRSTQPFLLVDKTSPTLNFGLYGQIKNGFKLPMQLPLNINTEFATNTVLIEAENAGYAIVRMYGKTGSVIVNPSITNLTNGTTVKIKKSLINENSHFVIDGVYKRMTDQDGANVEAFSDGGYIYLEEGANLLIYSSDKIL